MIGIAWTLWTIAVGLVAILVLLFCVEVAAAVFISPRAGVLAPQAVRPRIAVLVPAHNEGGGIHETIADIKRQLFPGDRLLIVADNCTDNTAIISSIAGAEVTERHDLFRIGKGFALDWGIKHLSADPPEIVIVIDADCRLLDNTLDQLAATCIAAGRPAQALNLMLAPEQSTIDYRVAMFAFRVKNWVRPLGLHRLDLPCQLMGTGMAFPWQVIPLVDLANGNQVEDLQLGLDLAHAGYPPVFVDSAGVRSRFPLSARGADSQRRRWEQGHMGLIRTRTLRFVGESLRRHDLRLFVLALDAAIPPLTLLGLIATSTSVLSGLGNLFGLSPLAFYLSSASVIGYALAMLLCCRSFGRDILPDNSVRLIASFITHKFSLYRKIFWRGARVSWIRTDREKVR